METNETSTSLYSRVPFANDLWDAISGIAPGYPRKLMWYGTSNPRNLPITNCRRTTKCHAVVYLPLYKYLKTVNQLSEYLLGKEAAYNQNNEAARVRLLLLFDNCESMPQDVIGRLYNYAVSTGHSALFIHRLPKSNSKVRVFGVRRKILFNSI